MNYLPTIGLEIHAELKTKSKMFCSCENNPDEEKPNKNICPICLGHPGTLPVLNLEAIRRVLKIGVAVNGKLADFTEWDRKNYFYPDIPKGYQISQYKYPLVSGGELAGVSIERIHLEEDTAQSTHDAHEKTLINFNRAGVPLMELVTKPVIHDAATAVRFARELQLLLQYLDASDANMEKGEMRVEANISVMKEGGAILPQQLGTKTEVKNLNSFRAVEKAIEYEIARQTSLLEKGENVLQETRGWDDTRNETFSQRSKESSHDYRYFPDPDIPKMKLSEIPEFAPAELKKGMPELPWVKRDRLKREFGMTDKEVTVFVESPKIGDYYESIVSSHKNDPKRVKLTTNYLLSDYIGLLKKEISTNKKTVSQNNGKGEQEGRIGQTESAEGVPSSIESRIASIAPATFAEFISMISSGEISSRGAKDLIAIMIKEGNASNDGKVSNLKVSPKALAEKHGLIQKSSSADIEPAIDKVIAENASVVAEYKKGKLASLQFLIGQAMKATKGAANPAVVRELLLKKLTYVGHM